MLCDAVKSVYASVFFADSKAYMNATSNVIDQEKMAIILQEVVGDMHGEYYYPSFSGVGRSLNYYPINEEVAEDGVVEVAAIWVNILLTEDSPYGSRRSIPTMCYRRQPLTLPCATRRPRLYALSQDTPESMDFKTDGGFNIVKVLGG